jgi:hypothetical protein
MKNWILLVGIVFMGCSDSYVEKPSKVIDEDEMVNIIYEMAILEAARTNHPIILSDNNIDPHTYIYKKFNIDSLQFAQNNRYYAQDIENYTKMYKKVSKRLNEQKSANDTLIKAKPLGEIKPNDNKTLAKPDRKKKIQSQEKPSLGGEPVSN